MKAELLDKYRTINVDWGDWWKDTQDCFKEDMKDYGIDVDEIQFSGFWNQGDGASFTGCVTDVDKFFKKFIEDDAYPFIRRLRAMDGEFNIAFQRHSFSNYSHENTVSAEIGGDYLHQVCNFKNNDFREAVIDVWDEKLELEVEEFEKEATDILRDLCRDLYSRLEQEHDYLTSDEAVAESIKANDLEVEEEDSDSEETDEGSFGMCCGAL